MASILGFGAYLPGRVVTHLDLAEQLGLDADWIFQACGIKERRYAAPGESVVDMAEKAALACLEGLGMAPSELGGILVGTGTPHRQFPGVSASLQQRLGVAGSLAFDIHLASSGGLMALCTAADLAGRYGPILVVGAERMSDVVQNHPARETTILFGDGAGACVVAPGEEGPWILEDWRMGGDGSFADDLTLEPGGPLVMNGRAVIMQANRKLTASVKDLMVRNRMAIGDVDLFLFHQANINLLRQVGRTLGIDMAKVFLNIERYGNTSAASVLIAASEAFEAGLLGSGRRAVMAAFGSGFTFGSALLRAR